MKVFGLDERSGDEGVGGDGVGRCFVGKSEQGRRRRGSEIGFARRKLKRAHALSLPSSSLPSISGVTAVAGLTSVLPPCTLS